MTKDYEEIPAFGWSVRMDHEFPQKRVQQMRPTIKQALQMLTLSIRYIFYYVYHWFKGRPPVMDFFKMARNSVKRGAPIGGIGSGTVGRSFLGDFCNFQMAPGCYEYETPLADQFIVTIMNESKEVIYQKVLCVKDKPPKVLTTWDWSFPAEDGDYVALYPRAWYTYNIKKYNIKLICRQVSPVIPNNYKDSSIPGAVFIWTVLNKNDFQLSVSLTFTFQNGTGAKPNKPDTISSEYFDIIEEGVSGISIKQEISGNPCTYTLGCTKRDNDISRCLYFNPNGDGKTVWKDLRMHGMLENSGKGVVVSNKELAVALCSQFTVPAQSESSTDFCLVWDMPVVRFPLKDDLKTKYYTKYFSSDGSSGPNIALYCLKNYPSWEKSICEWQKPILDDNSLPAWYKHAIFNELYYVSDGGTVWLLPFEYEKLKPDDPRVEYGHFAYLEGHEYRMYNTYDVHFYASFALAMLWPKLQTVLQYDIRDTVDAENPAKIWYLASGKFEERKKKGTVPHDVGDPTEDPFFMINSYPIHDVSEWRDLNLKFVLQVYRDYILFQDDEYLKYMFPKVITVMEKSLLFDKDNDGMIENSGTADQTYDCWVMYGTSAYCGSLWLGSLRATVHMADILSDFDNLDKYTKILEMAVEAYNHKLWNGKYYNFDCSSGENHSSIMADQLCGVWYMKCCSPQFDFLPDLNVKSAIMTIYENNVLRYYRGEQGAVNGMMLDGTVDRYSIQSEEMWTGVTYAVSSLLISQGFLKEGFKTAEGLVNTIYNKAQLGFCSPEALHGLKEFRSLGYMRPLSIWSIQLVLDNIKKANTQSNNDP